MYVAFELGISARQSVRIVDNGLDLTPHDVFWVTAAMQIKSPSMPGAVKWLMQLLQVYQNRAKESATYIVYDVPGQAAIKPDVTIRVDYDAQLIFVGERTFSFGGNWQLEFISNLEGSAR